MNFLHLVKFPCGCVAAAEHVYADRWRVACPWCGNALSHKEFAAWLALEKRVIAISTTRILVKAQDKLFEVVGECDDCLTPLVRERGVEGRALHVSKLVGAERLAN